MSEVQKRNIIEIKKESEIYPQNLKNIKGSPNVIYALGNINLLKSQQKKIAIVGTRKCTKYGKNMALYFAKKMSEGGITVISGLAIGVDSFAHMGAMVEKSKTIAVLPSGLRNIFPKENENLFKEIIQNGGLAISEYPVDTDVDEKELIRRNRIVAGLSNGILVVEGDYRSGASNTANIAIENDIPVFCIPNKLDNPKGYTPNLFIKKGAIIVLNEKEIIEKIKNKGGENKEVKREKKTRFEYDIEEKYKKMFRKEKAKIRNEEINTKKENNVIKYDIGKKYKMMSRKEEVKRENEERERNIIENYDIYKFIHENPVYIDDIVEKSNKDIRQINYEITMLILEGYIEELPGQGYVRKLR